jgi:hypothetical protein
VSDMSRRRLGVAKGAVQSYEGVLHVCPVDDAVMRVTKATTGCAIRPHHKTGSEEASIKPAARLST